MSDCKYGDPTCPCQDGDMCHYEGEKPWNVPPEYVRGALSTARAAAFREAAEESRRYASHYDPHSDGRNTFILLAEHFDAKAKEG